MTDEELLRQAANAPTMYFDGFGGYRKINGVLRCIGFIIGSGAQLNLVVSLQGAEAANRATREVLDNKSVTSPTMWSGKQLTH